MVSGGGAAGEQCKSVEYLRDIFGQYIFPTVVKITFLETA